MYIILNLLCTSNFHPLCFFVFLTRPVRVVVGHYLSPGFYIRIYDALVRGDLVVLLTVGCRALHITSTIKTDVMFTVIDYRNLSRFQASAGWLCVLTFTPLHTDTHTHTHAQIRHPHTDLSCLIRFLSFLPVWIWINRHKLSTGWIQRHAPPPPLPSLPASLSPSLSIGLQCVGVQQCVIGFSVQLCSLKPPPGSVGESQLQQGWAWPAGGRMGGR